jgi:hypothetical protein
MTTDIQPATFGRPTTERLRALAVAVVREPTLQDWILIAYLAVMTGMVLRGGGASRTAALQGLTFDIVAFMLGLVVYRGRLVRPPYAGIAYRLGMFGAIFLTFLQLDRILPAATSRVLDQDVHAFDLRVFGVEPSIAWDRFVTTTTTEWFAFFYYSYFFVLAVHILPLLFVERRKLVLAEASFGIVLVFCVAQLFYIVVPAYGPTKYLEHVFARTLEGGFWWPLVQRTVESVGPRADDFPSLHTAVPLFLAIFSFRQRLHSPFRYTWPIASFFTGQIMVATMFLRWHYLADIVAGVMLAVAANALAPWVVRREGWHRARIGLAPVWTDLRSPHATAPDETIP